MLGSNMGLPVVVTVDFPGASTMTSRSVILQPFVSGLLVFVSWAGSFAGESTPEAWDRTKAGAYLDTRGEQWFNFGAAHRGQGESKTTCVSCHSLLPFALARPALRRVSDEKVPTKLESRLLEQTKLRVSSWDKLNTEKFQLMYDFDNPKKKESHGTEAVLNALLLARDDRFQGRQEPNDETKKALSILWATQITDGERKGSWDWINFGMDPWESPTSPYMGACLAAIAVGSVPGHVLNGGQNASEKGLDSLRDYLKKHFAAQNLHNRVWMLWAAASLGQLLTPEEKGKLFEQIFAKQQADGGWSLSSLGEFARKGVKQVATPDGYATGLVLHVLQVAGLGKDDSRVAKGLAWLRSNQDPTGAWRAASVNKNRAPESKDPDKAHVGKFMWDAATGYSVLALCH
jgi:squalene-hopene/tetraprenyl-beta-curcumene cyclase